MCNLFDGLFVAARLHHFLLYKHLTEFLVVAKLTILVLEFSDLISQLVGLVNVVS